MALALHSWSTMQKSAPPFLGEIAFAKTRSPMEASKIAAGHATSEVAASDTLPALQRLPRASTAAVRDSDAALGATNLSMPAARLQAEAADYGTLSAVDTAHYVAIRDLARGGMGRIRIARDRRLGREVAIKELLVNAGDLPQRFEREARVTARLQHPSIVAIYEAGAWPSGEPFFAMRLVPGRSFDEVIADAHTLEARLALIPNALAVADAIAYAHSEGVIHRDLKPKNVLVGGFGETVVIDWGLAKDLRDADDAAFAAGSCVRAAAELETEVGEVMGTPAYMPPEQARGERVDARADVYALGALLYHLLAGRPPVAGRTTAEVLANLLDGNVPSLAEIQSDVPPDLLTIVGKALAHDPADRYPTARELAEDLRRFQTGQLVGAHRYSLGQLFRRWVRRHRGAVAVGSIALVVTAAIGVVAIMRIMSAQQRAETQRSLAVANKSEVEDMLDFMVGDLRGQLAPIGRVKLLDPVARKAVAYLDHQPPATNADDMRRRVRVRRSLGDVLFPEGDPKGALAQYEAALSLAHALVFLAPGAKSQLDLADIYGSLSDVRAALGDHARSLAARRLEIATLSGWPESVARTNRALAVLKVGEELIWMGNTAEAKQQVTAALHDLDALASEQAVTRPVTIGRMSAHRDFANVAIARGDLATAEQHLVAGTALADELLKGDSVDMSGHQSASRLHVTLERLYLGSGRLELAEIEGRKAMKISGELAAVDPANLEHQSAYAEAQQVLCTVRVFRHDNDESLSLCRGAVAIADTVAAKNAANAGSLDLLVTSYEDLGRVQFARGQTRDAIDSLTAAKNAAERLAAAEKTPHAHAQLAVIERSLANLYVEANRLGEARSVYELTIATIEPELGRVDQAKEILADTHQRLSVVLLRQHDLRGALDEANIACAQLQPLAKDRSAANFKWLDLYATAVAQRGDVRLAMSQRSAARADYREAFGIRDALWRTAPQLRNLQGMATAHAALAKKARQRH